MPINLKSIECYCAECSTTFKASRPKCPPCPNPECPTNEGTKAKGSVEGE